MNNTISEYIRTEAKVAVNTPLLMTPTFENKDGYFSINRSQAGDIFYGNACHRYNARMYSVFQCQCKHRGTFYLSRGIKRCYDMDETKSIYSKFFNNFSLQIFVKVDVVNNGIIDNLVRNKNSTNQYSTLYQ